MNNVSRDLHISATTGCRHHNTPFGTSHSVTINLQFHSLIKYDPSVVPCCCQCRSSMPHRTAAMLRCLQMQLPPCVSGFA